MKVEGLRRQSRDEGQRPGQSGRPKVGPWVHVACVYEGSRKPSHIYVDGKLVDSVYWSAFFARPDYQMQIGNGFGGGIARMQMWRGVKSAEEIAKMAKPRMGGWCLMRKWRNSVSERIDMNYRQLVLMVPLVGLVASGVIAEELDEIDKKLAREAPLFERAKMRGRVLDEVSRDVIKQTPGDGYQLRVVEWWPKKGVDLVEEPKGEPRTWTIREGKSGKRDEMVASRPAREEAIQSASVGVPGYWSGSKSMGDDVTKPITPAVVLRLPDGRKRCFVRGSFSDEDEKYIVDLYEKQMKVLARQYL